MLPLAEAAAGVLAEHREDGLDHGLGGTVIRYVPVRCLLVRLFSSEDAIMVSPSGTRGTGSTKVRAGRR